MTDFFQNGGYIMWPILLCALLVVGIAVAAGRRLGGGAADLAPVQSGLDAILFWGAFAVVLGVLGTVVGVMQMAQAIQLARQIEPVLVWGGLGVSLISTLFGLLVLSVALLVWFGLWSRYRKVLRRAP